MDRTAEYFAGPAQRRAHLLPRGFAATVRLDVRRPDGVTRWLLGLSEGGISVRPVRDPDPSGEPGPDLVICADADVFDRLFAGAEPTAAILRNELTFHGTVSVMFHFERLLPSPPDARGPQRVSAGAGERPGRQAS